MSNENNNSLRPQTSFSSVVFALLLRWRTTIGGTYESTLINTFEDTTTGN